MRLRRQTSPYTDERLVELHHTSLILYEINQAIAAALEEGPERARLTDADLQGIIYRAAYVLNYQRSPMIEGFVDAAVSVGGLNPRSTKPDGSDHFKRGQRDGAMDRKRRAKLT